MIPLFSSLRFHDRRYPQMAKIWTDIWQLTFSPAFCLDGNVYDTVYFIKIGKRWDVFADGKVIDSHPCLRSLRKLFWYQKEVI